MLQMQAANRLSRDTLILLAVVGFSSCTVPNNSPDCEDNHIDAGAEVEGEIDADIGREIDSDQDREEATDDDAEAAADDAGPIEDPCPTGGIVYYVDSTGGDDEEGGTSQTTAWRTIDRVNSANIDPGSCVLFRRGEIWREGLVVQSGEEGSPITYGAYGTGNKPLLLGSRALNERADWTQDGSNIWVTTRTFDVDVGNIIFDGESMCGIKVWNEGDLSEQGDFWYDESNQVVRMYSQENPANYYEEIELALRRHIINEGEESFVIIQNLDLRYGGAHGIGGGNAHHIIVRDMDISFIGGGDQYGGNATVRFGNGIEFWADAQDILVERCRISEIYDAALTNQSNRSSRHHNIFYTNNIIWNSEYCFEYFNNNNALDGTPSTHEIHFENNTCINSGFGWGHIQRSDPTGRHLCFYKNTAETSSFYVRNNIFYRAAAVGFMMRPMWNDLENLVLDHNLWYQPTGVLIDYQGTHYTEAQWTEFQSETNKSAHSLIADPLFQDLDGLDVHLLSDSPAIDTGTPVSGTSDFDGHSVPLGDGFDMGAYEFVP